MRLKPILAVLALSSGFLSAQTPTVGPNGEGVTPATSTAFNAALGINTQAVPAADLDWTVASYFTKTLGANTTLTFSNIVPGKSITVAITGAGGYRVDWPASVSWIGENPAPPADGFATFYRFTAASPTEVYGSVEPQWGQALGTVFGGTGNTAGAITVADGSLSVAKIDGLQAALNGIAMKVDLASLSATGGPGKVLELTSAGSISLTPGTISGDALISSDGAGGWGGPAIYLHDMQRLWFLNKARNSGGSIFFNTAHGADGGELQINSDHRMALCLGTNGCLQLGLAVPGSTQFVFLQQRGVVNAGNTTVSSIPFYYNAAYFDGSVGRSIPVRTMAVPDGNTGNVFLDWYNPATMESGYGSLGTGTLAMRLSKSGLSLPTQTITDTNAVITKPLGDARYKKLFSKQAADKMFSKTSIALQATDISVNLVAGVTYEIEVLAIYECNPAYGVQHKLAYTGTLVTVGGVVDIGNAGVPVNILPISGTRGDDGYNNPIRISGGATTSPVVRSKVVYTATSDGTLTLQGAQAVAGVKRTVLKSGSYLTAEPL